MNEEDTGRGEEEQRGKEMWKVENVDQEMNKKR